MFFVKNYLALFRKNFNFFKFVEPGNFAAKGISNINISFKHLFSSLFESFLQESKIFTVGKVAKYDADGKFFEEKTQSVLNKHKASSTKIDGENFATDS